jgi:hypothetical protein
MASDGAYFVKSNYVACVDKFHVLTFVVSAGGMSWFGFFPLPRMARDGAYFVKSNYVACVDKFHVLTYVVSAGGMSWFGFFLVFVLHAVREDLTFVTFNMMSRICVVVYMLYMCCKDSSQEHSDYEYDMR